MVALAALVDAASERTDFFAANESLAADAGVEAGIFLLLFTFFLAFFVDALTLLPASKLAVDTEPALGSAGATFFLAALFFDSLSLFFAFAAAFVVCALVLALAASWTVMKTMHAYEGGEGLVYLRTHLYRIT